MKESTCLSRGADFEESISSLRLKRRSMRTEFQNAKLIWNKSTEVLLALTGFDDDACMKSDIGNIRYNAAIVRHECWSFT
jgi:hypothetical protein